MRLRLIAISGALALAGVGFGSVAQAEPGVSVRVGPGGVGVRLGDRHHRYHGRRHHRGRHYGWGPGFYFFNGYYHGNCAWLRHKARETGARVWWHRYRRCRAG